MASAPSVACHCGAVKIQLASECLWRLECCCFNCTTALWYGSTQGGPPAPKHQCIDSFYFANDFKVVQGEEHLGAWHEFEGADSTRFYCKKCWSNLVIDHPAYGGKILLTQSPTLTGTDSMMKPQGRHFMKDLSSEQKKELEKELPWQGEKDTLYDGVSDNFLAALPGIIENQTASPGEMNLQVLLEKVGPPLVPDGVERLKSGPPTFMQQAAAAAAAEEGKE